MAALKYERDVLLLKLKALTVPKTIPAECPILPIQDLLKIIEKAYDSGEHYAVFDPKAHLPSPGHIVLKTRAGVISEPISKNIVYMSDFQKSPDGRTFRILFKRGDPDIANPSFTDIENNTSRTVNPKDGETVAQSAHLIISLENSHKSISGYRACLEQITGISRSLIFPYLNGIVDHYTKTDPRFSYQTGPKKKRETRRYRPSFDCKTSPSTSLKNDIEKGYLSSIEFINTKADHLGADADPTLKSVTNRVHFRFKPISNSEMADKKIRLYKDKARKEGFDYIRVSVRDNDKEKYVSSRFKIEEGDALDKLFSRAEMLTDFEDELKACYDSIHTELADAMIGIIKNNTKW